jgi:hypothetical protein
MPLTNPEAEHLLGLVDDLRVAHESVLDTLRDMRTEREALVKIATIAGLYVDARNGLNELDPSDLLAHLDKAITTHQELNKGTTCDPTT